MAVLKKILSVGEGKKLKNLEALVPKVASFEKNLQAMSDDILKSQTQRFKDRLAKGESLEDILPEAFATVREAATRVLGQRHYDVQIVGGAALHFGWVAEMKTGEGKTLVSTLPAYLNALTGNGVHIVTVNDYLAKRDATWMGQVHRFLGLTVGMVLPDIDDEELKRQAYACDITYGTNNEFGFDYLRDNMAVRKIDQVQRGHNFAIVDEVDSILIDEARTPLIISGPASDSNDLYKQFSRIVKGLVIDRDYEVDEAKFTVSPTEEGIERVENALGIDNLYEHVHQNFVHQLNTAIKAKELYKKGVDYIIQDGEVKIVDEFTGRILEGRRWSDGIHQAVEAKENVVIQEENQTLATVTLQNYFKLYEKVSGMTGTGVTEAGEFMHTYGLEVVSIPTHRPAVRSDNPDYVYKSEAGKYNAVVKDLIERHNVGQPVLVGTVSVEKSERLSRMLTKVGIKHHVLNAKEHTQEGPIIAQAGRVGSVTVATNMAGRGVDILLGGNPEGLASQEFAAEGKNPNDFPDEYNALVNRLKAECDRDADRVRDLGGLYVLGTERHESRRIDNQLRGRAGRQGDPGESRFYLSLEDDLMRLFANNAMNWVMSRAFPEDVPLEAKMVSKAIERAQQTVEGRNFEIRKDVLKYDEVMNEQRKIIYRRRQQILDGEDLNEETYRIIADVVTRLTSIYCEGEYSETWNIESLLKDIDNYYPISLSVEKISTCRSVDELQELIVNDALDIYSKKELQLGSERMRDIERRVMLDVIDSHWREHLYEMDYLREGINLRAMGQRDPVTEWQREGFQMFSAMMESVEDDFVQFVMKLEIVQEETTRNNERLSYQAPTDPVQGSSAYANLAMDPAIAAAAQGEIGQNVQAAMTPVHVEETPGRNDPCFCGSGKKYKHCHGK
ncbi:MAG: preprotein translocase subunit SecA [Acidimicrobiia bacterium]